MWLQLNFLSCYLASRACTFKKNVCATPRVCPRYWLAEATTANWIVQGLAQLCCLSSAPLTRRLMDRLLSVCRCAKETFLPWSYSFGKNSARQNLSAFPHTNVTDKGPRLGFVTPEISINNRLLYSSLLYFFLMLHPSPFLHRVIATQWGICFGQSHLQRTCRLIFTESLWCENRENRMCIILSCSWKCSLVRVSPPSPAFKWSKTYLSSTALWLLLLWVATVT